MNHAYSHKVGLTLGGTAAILHVVWSILVFGGFAPSFLKWIWGLHFVSMNVAISPFSFSTAITLIIVAGIVGYVVGYIIGELWNYAGKGK